MDLLTALTLVLALIVIILTKYYDGPEDPHAGP